MCGIAGILAFDNKSIEPSLIKAMADAMVHRGPDDEGYYLRNNPGLSIALGHRRLSIIDLKTGHQPMHNEKKNIWVIHNGEIYNFRQLRRSLEEKGHVFSTYSDTEVIVHAYEEYGEDAVRHFRGMFAFAIWDEEQKKLVLARDRIGKKPLLYSQLNDKLVFASEFKAILKHPDVDREVDLEAIHHYLTYLCVPAPLTGFRSIKKLPPAHILIYQNGKVITKKYWELDFSKKIKITEEEGISQIQALLKDAVDARLVSDVPLGTLLSGGVDSSCVTAFMSQSKIKSLRTFSIGFGEEQFNELPYANFIADYFATRHSQKHITPNAMECLPTLVEHYGEPFADSSALPTYYACKVAREGVKVALNGDGGDEIFGGYRRHLAGHMAEVFGPVSKMINRSPLKMFFNAFPDKPTNPRSPGSIRRFLDATELNRAHRHMHWIGFFSEDFKRKLYTDEFKKKTNTLDSSRFLTDAFSIASRLDSIDAALYVDTVFGLQNDLLVKMDIASMANSLETRSPLLDQHLMEFLASLPSDFKIRNFSLKYIFKRTLKGLVPDKVLKRAKRGFAVPVDEWFRGPLRRYLVDIVLSPRALERGYFKRDSLCQVIEAHIKGKNNYGQHLWGLLILELWHRRFIDRD